MGVNFLRQINNFKWGSDPTAFYTVKCIRKVFGQRYIELNPVKAGMVQHAGEYQPDPIWGLTP